MLRHPILITIVCNLMCYILDTNALTNRLSEATECIAWPPAKAWGFNTITALRAEN